MRRDFARKHTVRAAERIRSSSYKRTDGVVHCVGQRRKRNSSLRRLKKTGVGVERRKRQIELLFAIANTYKAAEVFLLVRIAYDLAHVVVLEQIERLVVVCMQHRFESWSLKVEILLSGHGIMLGYHRHGELRNETALLLCPEVAVDARETAFETAAEQLERPSRNLRPVMEHRHGRDKP